MDKAQKELIKSYYHARGIVVQGRGHSYKTYEYSPYALDNGIINLDALSIADKYELFQDNKSVRNYVAPLIDAYNKNAKGFLRLLLNYNQTGDGTALLAFLKKSEFLKENGDVHNIEINSQIDLAVEKEKLLREIGLENEYDYMQGYVNNQNSSWVDNDELQYMQNSFTGTQQAKVKKIAKVLGISNSEIDDFWSKEGELTDFFEDNKLSQVNETFMEQLSAMKSNAEEEGAKDLLKNFPFDFNYSYGYRHAQNSLLDVDATIRYFYEHDPKPIATFDEFLSYVEDNNGINTDNFNEHAMQFEDDTDLQFYITRDLDEILDGFEDTDSDYYERVQGQREVQAELKKNGFTFIPHADENSPFATREQKDKIINVMDWKTNAEGTPMIEVEIIYKEELDKGDKVRTGWIYATKLGNYVDQYEIPELREDKI